jgi:hypothetical protein
MDCRAIEMRFNGSQFTVSAFGGSAQGMTTVIDITIKFVNRSANGGFACWRRTVNLEP